MTQISSGLNLPHLSKTKSPREIEKASSPHSLPIANLETRDAPRTLTVLWEHRQRKDMFKKVLKRLEHMEFAGKAYVEHYLMDMNRRNLKQESISHTLGSLRLFLKFLKNTGKTRLEEMTRQDLEAFIENEQDRGLKLSSIRTDLGRIYTFVRFLVEEGTLHPDVLSRRIRLKLPESLPRAINPDDLRQILSLIWDIRDRVMILVLLRSGMRIGELLDTKVSDVNIKERQITISQGVKNRRGRIVYLSDDASDALKLWLKKRDTNEPYLFYGRGMKLSYSTARWIFLNYLRKAHLAHKGYSLHSLRHTFASELLNAGMRLECLQELLGHDNIEVTRRYARLTDKTREEEYFRAMEIIERGEINGHYRLDSELQATLEEKELFSTHRKELPS
jgi:integrase/recombinase XerD